MVRINPACRSAVQAGFERLCGKKK